MTTEQLDQEIMRRHFVAIATAEYDDQRLQDLPQVRDEVRDLAAWLCDERLGNRRFTHAHKELAENPTKEQVRAVLEHPEPGQMWRETDAVVVYITGHGIPQTDGHWLALRATNVDKYKSTALRTADIVGWLTDTNVRHLLLIIDTCYAGDVAGGIVAFPGQLPETWVVLASAGKDERAAPLLLTRAIRDVVAELGGETGAKYGTDPYLPAQEFFGGVYERLDGRQRLVDLGGWLPGGLHGCLPNPYARPAETVPTGDSRSDLALPAKDMAVHWEPKSRGVTTQPAVGWLFTGRANLMRRLIEVATTGDPGAVLVTGRAGSGKSAALARLVTLSDPEFRRRYRYELTLIPDDLTPPAGAVHVAVLATGKSATEVMTQICRATGALSEETKPELSPEEAWDRWIGRRSQPVTIVVDALDEAGSPEELVKVLRRLCGLQPGKHGPPPHPVRLIVGVRSIGTADRSDSAPATRAGIPLADLVQQELRIEAPRGRIQVDEDPWWARRDLVEYVISLLRTLPDSPYREAEAGPVSRIANIVADAARRSFLFASMAASQLVQRGAVVEVGDQGWRASISQGVLGLFREDLHRSLPSASERLQAVHLLRAVAFAFGPGLPWRTIWPLVATAVADDGYTYGDGDIAWLLGTRLGGYLVTDRADGVTVYRLFHDDLRGILYDHWEELL